MGKGTVCPASTTDSVSHRLNDPARGLFIPAMVFVDIRDIAPGSVCLVLASTHYDMSRSIRSLDAYLAEAGAL